MNITKTSKKGGFAKSNWTLNAQERKHFYEVNQEKVKDGKPFVLWGWKRDKVVKGIQKPESRTIYFSADFGLDNNLLYIKRAYFFLESRAEHKEIDYLYDKLDLGRNVEKYDIKIYKRKDASYHKYSRLRIEIGSPTDYDISSVKRRLKGKPRLWLDPPRIVPESTDYNLAKYAPFVVFCGSGVSAESGLPLLGSVHNLFEVDDRITGKLTFGKKDGIPNKVVEDPVNQFKKFCSLDVKALKVEPSQSHKLLADLYRKHVIRQVLTDNVDAILKKAGIPYVQTRLSIFPDRYHAKFDPKAKAMLVLGIAVDRRDVIKQARRKGLKIIVVNPVYDVAPHSRNMDYLRVGDVLFKDEAIKILPKILKASKF